MKIWDEITALKARVTELENKPAVDTSTFASIDALNAVTGRVSAIEDEVGTDPSATPGA